MSEPEIKPLNRLSAVWIIPIVALLIAAWTLVQNIRSQGPEVRITFASAAGLKAGETQVRLLDVEIGRVEEVRLGENYDEVIAVVRLSPETTDLLTEDAQFWVVRPRIGSQGISGLSTLLSGAYIELAPGSGAPGRRQYRGLDDMPLTPPSTPGLQFRLLSNGSVSVNVGSPVLYNGYEVGRVESIELDETGKTILTAFVDAPYDDLITTATRFWNASGVAVDMDGQGFSLRTESLESLLTGGVSFSFPDGSGFGKKVQNGVLFLLYDNHTEAMKNPHLYGEEYVLLFESSVRGLLPNAPVEYRGLRVGTVMQVGPEDADPQELWKDHDSAVPVLINLEPGWLGADSEESAAALSSELNDAISRGLRGSLTIGNLLTGSLFVSLDFHDNAEAETLTERDGVPVLPTRSTGLSQIEDKVVALLNKLQGLPLEDTLTAATGALENMEASLADAGSTLATVDELLKQDGTQALPENLVSTLQEVQTLLRGLSDDAPLRRQLESTLRKLEQTLGGANALLETYETKPNAFIFGEETGADPVPGGDQP